MAVNRTFLPAHARPRHRYAFSLVLLTALTAVTGCAGQAEPEPERLTVTGAGTVYLEAVCPINAAWDEADAAIDALRIVVAREPADTAAEASALTHAIAALGTVNDETEQAITQLDPATHTWPDIALDPVEDVREQLRLSVEQVDRVRALEATEMAEHQWVAGESSDVAAAARASLGLPDTAEVACAEWAAVQ